MDAGARTRAFAMTHWGMFGLGLGLSAADRA